MLQLFKKQSTLVLSQLLSLSIVFILSSCKQTANKESTSSFFAEPLILNVKDYGAKGDSLTKDTKAIQETINACHKEGGGTVRIPRGSYIIGTLYLKSNITLSLEKGAYLYGSHDIKDYPTEGHADIEGFDEALLYAQDATNISIEGLGTIDGRGYPHIFPQKIKGQKERPHRPQLLIFVNCQHLRFSSTTFTNPAFWGLHLINCTGLHFDAVTIDSKENNPNNDGIDLDGCQDVVIENSKIHAGDDAVCLKSTTNRPCKNILVKNCDISSHTAGFKCGTSSKTGFQNIKVIDSWFHDCPMGAVKLQAVDGGKLENVELSRLVMDKVGGPFFIRLGNRGKQYQGLYTGNEPPSIAPEQVGSIKNIQIKDIVAHVSHTSLDRMGIMITGIPDHYIEDITLENIHITYPGGGTSEHTQRAIAEDIARYPEQFFFGVLPSWGAYIRHAKNITFNNVNLLVQGEDQRKKIVTDDVHNFQEN